MVPRATETNRGKPGSNLMIPILFRTRASRTRRQHARAGRGSLLRRASVVAPGGLTDQSPVVTRMVYMIVSAAIATSDLPPSGRTAPRSGGSEARAARRRGYGRRGRPPISHLLSIWTQFAEPRELARPTPLERPTTSPIRLQVLPAAEPFRAPALVQSRPQPTGPRRDSRAVARLPSRR